MRQPAERLFRDNVHADIVLDELASAIIDTREFQRLDGIRQLGFAYLAYRAAKHSRFDHSVGTYWLARQIVYMLPDNHRRFGIDFPYESLNGALQGEVNGQTQTHRLDGLARVVSYAALLHDVTHIPFGHTLEDEFVGLYRKHDDMNSPRLWALLYTPGSELAALFSEDLPPWTSGISNSDLRDLIVSILLHGTEYRSRSAGGNELVGFPQLLNEVAERLPDDDEVRKAAMKGVAERFRGFVEEGLYHEFMSDIVGNTICADLLDYIRRDLRGTAINLDYDDRILRHFVVADQLKNDAHALRLALNIQSVHKTRQRIDIVGEIWNLLEHRFRLAERVYYHPVKAAASTMLAKALQEAAHPEDVDPYTKDGVREDTIISPHMTDSALLGYILARDDEAGPAKELVLGIVERKLYKPCVVVDAQLARDIGRLHDDVNEFVQVYRDDAGADQRRLDLEKRLAKAAGIDPAHVILYCPAAKMQAKAADALLQLDGLVVQVRSSTQFRVRAASLAADYLELWKMYVFIHPQAARRSETVEAILTEFAAALEIPEKHRGRLSWAAPAVRADEEEAVAEAERIVEASEVVKLWSDEFKELAVSDLEERVAARMSGLEVQDPAEAFGIVHSENALAYLEKQQPTLDREELVGALNDHAKVAAAVQSLLDQEFVEERKSWDQKSFYEALFSELRDG